MTRRIDVVIAIAAVVLPIIAALLVFTGSASAKPATWPTTSDGTRTVVTMWGTVKTVTCGDLRWLVRHGDLDPHTLRRRGDAACGRA